MPRIYLNGTELYYEDTGGPAETVLLSHGLLWSGRMFEAQVAALRDRYRVITYDHRGQGRSAPPTERVVSIETVTADAIALIERLGVGPVHFCGLSMGGFVGMRIAARRPELVRSLVLMETTADPEPEENVPKYRRLAFVAEWFGLRLVAGPVMKIMFSRTFLADPAREADRARWRNELIANRRDIVAAVRGVIEREGVYEELAKIRCPTLVIVGEEDTATVPEKAERIRAAVRGATLVRVPGAGHTSSVEQPALVSQVIGAFLDELTRIG